MLSEEQQDRVRIAIAKKVGYTWNKAGGLIDPNGRIINNHYGEPWRLPDYCNSYDALFPVIQKLDCDKLNEFIEALCDETDITCEGEFREFSDPKEITIALFVKARPVNIAMALESIL